MTVLASTFSYGVKSKIFYLKTVQRGFVCQKYVLNRSMYELKLVRLLCLSPFIKQYKEGSR